MTHRTGVLFIDRTQLACLADFLEAELTPEGCDGTLRHAERWATQHGLDWRRLATGLKRLGGYCDCEVLMNCVPDDMFEEHDDPDQ